MSVKLPDPPPLSKEDLKNEEWKQSLKNPNIYISNMGRYKKGKKGEPIFVRAKYGSINAKGGSLYMPREVANLFVPNPYKYKHLERRDRDKANHRADNLVWAAHKGCLGVNGVYNFKAMFKALDERLEINKILRETEAK